MGTIQQGDNLGIRLSATIALSILFLAALFNGCNEHEQAANQLLDTYRSGCRSMVGTWTDDAMAHTQGLIRTLDFLKTQTQLNCGGTNGALQSVNSIYDQMNRLAIDETTRQYREAQQARLDLLLTIQTETDPNTLQALRLDLYSTTVELAHARANLRTQDLVEQRQRLVQGLTQLTNYTAGLLNQDSNLVACYKDAPYMAFQMAGSLMAISGAFATPQVGAALAAAGHMFNTTLKWLSTASYDSAILKAKRTDMETALMCGLEAMTNLYCDAQMTNRFLNLAKRSYKKGSWEPTVVWRGLDLLGRRYPILNAWLFRVRNGVQPADVETADRYRKVWEKVNLLQDGRRTVQGLFNRTRRLIDGADPEQVINYTRNAFSDAFSYMYYPPTGTRPPLAGFGISSLEAICKMSGDPKCKPPEGSVDPFQFLNLQKIEGGFGSLVTRTYDLFTTVEKQAMRELKREITQDSKLLLEEAKVKLKDNLSPLEVLRSLSSYFKQSAKYFANRGESGRAVTRLATETSEKLDRVIAKIEPDDVNANDAINFVFDEFWLLTGTQVISDRIAQIIRWDMEGRIRHGDLPAELSKDLLASGRDIRDELEHSGFPLEEITDIQSRLDRAKEITVENLELFLDKFDDSLETALDGIRKSSLKADTRFNWAKLCTLIASSSEKWPSAIDVRLCRNTILDSGYPGSGIFREFNRLEKLDGRPLHEKICTFYNFRREARLYRYRNSDTR